MSKHTTRVAKNKSGWHKRPDYSIEIEHCTRRIQVHYQGNSIADSKLTLLVLEQDHLPVYYFPQNDVCMDILQPSEKITFCPYKGEANHWSLHIKEQHIDMAAWHYADPFDEVKILKNYIAFYPEAGDLIS